MKLHTLSNGLKVLLDEERSRPVISFNALINVGSAYETDEEAGIAHVIEHMLFKGTPTRPTGTLAYEVEAAGGDINAYTSFDQTVYYIHMASRYAEKGLEILADAVQHPLFDEAELASEQEVILEEVRRSKDNPSHELSDHLFRSIFRKQTYGRPIIGFPKTVTSFRQTHLRDFHRRWYTPHNIVFIVVGDFETTQMLRKIESAFTGYTGTPTPKLPESSLSEPQQQEFRFVAEAMHIQLPHFGFGFRIPEMVHSDIPALDILSHILGGSDSSRLEQVVKEKKKLVHRISSYSYTMKHTGVFAISGLCDDGKARDANRAIGDEIARLQEERVTTSELSRTKLNIRAHEVYERETVGGQGGKLAYLMACTGRHDFETDYYHALAEVTAEDVRRVAQTYLSQNRCNAVYIAPNNSTILHQKKSIANSLSWGIKPSSQTKRKKPTSPEPKIKRLRNGLTLVVQENRKLPLVSLIFAAHGGTRYETLKINGISALTTNVVTKGTKTRSAATIAHDIEKMAGDLEAFSGRNSLGVRAECLSEHLRDGFELFSDVLTQPAFEKTEVTHEKRLLLKSIKQQEDQLSQLAFIHFLKTLYPKHPYGFRSLGTPQSVSSLTAQKLSQYWHNTVQARGSVLSVVGDTSLEEIVELAEELLINLPVGKKRQHKLRLDPQLKEPKVVQMTKKEKQQSHIVFGFQGPTLKSDDRYAMTVLNNILAGQGGRLFLKLRDEMSLAYAVSSVLQVGIDPGHFAVYIGTDPRKTETAVEAIKQQLEAIRTKLTTMEELQRAKQYLVGTYALEQQKNSSLATQYAYDLLYHGNLEEGKQYEQRILAVTREEIKKAAERYILPDAYALAIVGPSLSRG